MFRIWKSVKLCFLLFPVQTPTLSQDALESRGNRMLTVIRSLGFVSGLIATRSLSVGIVLLELEIELVNHLVGDSFSVATHRFGNLMMSKTKLSGLSAW